MEWSLVLRWGVVLALLTTTGAPIAALVFAHLPRRGAAFSLPVAVLAVTTVVFLVGQVRFGFGTVLLGVLVTVGLAGAAYNAGGVPDWRAVAATYGVFLGGFLLYAVYSSHNAGITPAGGEQFLHFGLTNALASAEVLPSEDFWYAGQPLRYYYGTQLQIAWLSMLSRTAVRYGYYLGLASFYGILFVCAYGLAGALVASRGRSYHLGGILGVTFVALGGTTTTFFRLLFGWLPSDVSGGYGRGVFRALVEERGFTFREAVASQGGIDQWDWFYERYVVEGALHEFPLYSFVKADLHGHTLSTGYIVLAGAIAFSYYRTPAERRWLRLGLVYGCLGVVAGVFGFMNTWSLPTAVILAGIALAAGDAHPATLLPDSLGGYLIPFTGSERSVALPHRVGAEAWRLVLAGVLALPVGVIGIAVASPFVVFGSVPTNEGIGLLPSRTPLGQFLVLYGGLLVLFGTSLALRSRETFPFDVYHVAGGLLLAVVTTLFFVLDMGVFAVTVPLMASSWWLVRTDRAGFAVVLVFVGLGLLLSMELVHARVYPFERERWNTTLKVAIQGWTVAAVGAGAISALLLAEARDRLGMVRRSFEIRGTDVRRSVLRVGFPWVLVVLVVVATVGVSLPFAGLVVYHEVGDDVLSPGEGTLDGLAIHDQHRQGEMEAMYWLDERGRTTIVEAPGRDSYRWRNSASVFTDAVSVVGWVHQVGYRGESAYDTRATHVETLYTGSPESVISTLRRYGVDYIYVGPGEREVFGDITDFERIDGISVAFENEAVTIFAVDHQQLPPDASDSRANLR